MVTFRMGETVIRRRPTALPDPYSGADIDEDWSAPQEKTIENVAIGPSSTFAATDALRTQVTTQMSAYADYAADIRHRDRLVTSSGVWRVEADVMRWRNPYRGTEEGLEVRITRVEG